MTGTASHEFTHLLVAEAAGNARSQVPAWLNEGLAEFGNIDPTDSYDAALRYGIYTRRLRPLWYQHSFGGTPDDIIIAYGQGRSVVNFMISKFGIEKMAELFQVLQSTLDIDLALQQVYGLDQFGLDTDWRLAIGDDDIVRGTVSHEFTHLLVSEAAGRASGQVPAWLSEGLAEFGNIDPTDLPWP